MFSNNRLYRRQWLAGCATFLITATVPLVSMAANNSSNQNSSAQGYSKELGRMAPEPKKPDIEITPSYGSSDNDRRDHWHRDRDRDRNRDDHRDRDRRRR